MLLRITLCIITVFASINLLAQETELDKRNGFKDIKLGVTIDSVKGTKFKKDIKEKGHYPAKLYEVEHADYESIGEIKVKSIEVKTYKDLVYEIFVVTEKDTRLMKALEMTLGKANYDIRGESYNWAGQNLGLRFKSHSKNELELTYTSFNIHKMMKADKEKKVEEIADDF